MKIIPKILKYGDRAVDLAKFTIKVGKTKLKNKIKSGVHTWHVLFKNVNYLNTVSEKDQIDHNLTKMRT